ncbi:hypothetical protein V9T40_008465 [Parthenolecanium corni]|uniref:Exocyst complex component 5 n=1 Tax=Parthenolecanium corni TaxID=536013 RepID=A0AAN9Y759_9HEMI
MMQQYMRELEQKPFDPDTFVERLAWRVLENTKEKGTYNFNADVMKDTFEQSIKDLMILLQRQRKKCESLKIACKEEEKLFWQDLFKQQQCNKECVDSFYQLDEKINSVAVKVMHLGGQLETVNIPRSRAEEAQKLMTYFSEFLIQGNVSIDVFSDSNRLFEAADIIRKLFFIAQELPGGRFEEAKKKIEQKYDEIERSLLEEFSKAEETNNLAKMKEIASILSHFKGYSQCVDVFIEQSQLGAFHGRDVFNEVIPLCEKNFKIIATVFNNPEQINAKFVLNIYHLKLQSHIKAVLSDSKDSDKYLKNLMDLYSKLQQLSINLSKFSLGSDPTYLKKLTQNIFHKYLDSYIGIELRNIKDKYQRIHQKFYESKGHQKKQITASSFQELRRDIQAVIGTRANINIAQIEDYGGEIFLSEEITVYILQEAKEAFKRCQLLSNSKDLPSNAMQIFEILLQYLITEYVDYAIDLGIQSVPIPESNTQQPDIYFFEIVQQTNIIVHLLEKLIQDCLFPLIESTARVGDCLSRKKCILEQTEMKLDTGLDRSINAVVGWVKVFLQAEQKRTDFKPETDVDTVATSACKSVVLFMRKSIKLIQECLHGKNAENVLIELGIRFHRVIYDHLCQYSYNSAGALCAICDVNEYRKCIKEVNSSLITTLFDTLYALCNLLLVKPENLEQVCCDETLAVLDNGVLNNFIQLRSDFKSQKLSASLKGLIS